jgi:hypothetical protein
MVVGQACAAAFIVSAENPGQDGLRAMSLLARQNDLVVTDLQTHMVARQAFGMRAIDAVSVPSVQASSFARGPLGVPGFVSFDGDLAPEQAVGSIPVFEVTREISAKAARQSTASEVADSLVTSALQQCVKGKYGDALLVLQRLPYDVKSERMVRRLVSAASACNKLSVPAGMFAQREEYLSRPPVTPLTPGALRSGGPLEQARQEKVQV